MAEGVEIVIRPKHIERAIFIIVIIVLVVLLIIKGNGGGSGGVDTNETAEVAVESEINTMNETLNASVEVDLCTNAIKDQDETDVDCGGDICDSCGEFKFCNVDSDCASEWCRGNVKCVNPSCEDGEKNQDESNVDCGGTCGGFFYDNACFDEPQPHYSGRVELSILDVETSTNDDTGFAKINSVKFKIENGKADDVVVTAFIYARKSSGAPYYENFGTGEEVAMASVNVPLLIQGDTHTETVEIKRTLTETDPDDEYSVVIEIRDDDDKLIKEAEWFNT
ncbi:MAG: hypothetical protein KKF46_05090 [Nanoarchaeota archaeon]|nr:hypothetical protein [Nanoarchaeota archaeon]MBU1321709.1 hypothetical protein [Nanoarchaeota archaeon]MBU1597675.1 hypothetical protein [Nanoarchaeota archaeon]MBU2441025.1 hypothetical protein [Nanoarchaeota archaeon]